jgi:3-oxoadipate enol-lactonase
MGAAPLKHADLGPLAGEPVLFVHGFPLTGQMWLKSAERLDSANPGRFRSIAPDLPGFGRSPAVEGATLGVYADLLAGLLEHAGVDRPATVVGLSMGGSIALELLARHRVRVGALALVCCRSEADTPEKREQREALAQRALSEGPRVAAEAVAPMAFHPEAPEALVSKWTERMASAGSAEGVAGASRALAAREDRTAMLGSIDVPTLVVAGDGDRITPVSGMRSMAQAIPGARLEIVEGAGHLPPVERPGRFADVLGSFLAGLGEG